MSYSENLTYGWKDIESKLSFLIFPLMLLLSYQNWTKEMVFRAKNGLIVGVICSIVISFGRAFACKFNGGEICFRNDQFGYNMHATYLSVMYIMSVFFVFERDWKIKNALILKVIYVLLVLVSIYFMKSLSSFIAAAFLMTGVYFWLVVKSRKWVYFSLIPILIIVGIIAINKLPAISGEIKRTIETVNDYQKNPDDFIKRKVNWNESNTVRIVVWNFSTEIIADHPLGVGTGDVKDQLFNVYRSRGYDLFAEKQLNAHNQFLQTGIAIGVGAMLLLFLVLVGPLLTNGRKLIPIIAVFISLVFMTCLFESFLERQAGIIFFSFILIVLIAEQFVSTNALSER
jgi:O-antigen ligase